MSYGQDSPAGFSLFGQRLGLIRIKRHRLLNQHVAAGCKCGRGETAVGPVRCGNHHCLDCRFGEQNVG
jgi:hypothetical protein